MARSTVSQTIYGKYLEAIKADPKIPPEVAEKIAQLQATGKLSDPQSLAALLKETEEVWRSSNR